MPPLRASHQFAYSGEHEVIEVIMDEQARKDHDVVALDPRHAQRDIQEDHHDSRGQRQSHVEEVVRGTTMGAGDLLDNRTGNLSPLLAEAIQIPGQTKILKRMPDIHSLERHVEVVCARNDVGETDGDDDEKRLREVRTTLLNLDECLTNVQREADEEQATGGVDDPLLADDERNFDPDTPDDEAVLDKLHHRERVETREDDGIV